MATINVDVDVDLCDFDLYEILTELESRYKSNYSSKKDNKEKIDDFIKKMKTDCDTSVKISILDKMKIDLLAQNLNKISLNDLENLLIK